VEAKQWERIKELFGAALERDPGQRAVFLDQACGQNVSLRKEVESLLHAHDTAGDTLEPLPDISAFESTQVRSIGPYQLLDRIGEGGMGQVWLAQQTAPLQRRVALKLIRWGMYDDNLLHRFPAERQSLAVMDHPSIAKVFDAGTTPEGQPYFVMEYVPGVPLTEYCDQKNLKIRDRLELFIKVCEGVQHAHQKAVIHRDLKPANILVVEIDGKPVPRIIDFGVAKATNVGPAEEAVHTRVGGFVGTPGYMSPEQCDPTTRDVDTRTDVYSLGVVLYVLLAGSLPFDTKEWKNKPFDEMLRRLREEDPPRPSTKISTGRDRASTTAQARGVVAKQLIAELSGDLDWITMKAVEKDRTRRYGTPSELAADLSRYLNNEPVTARPASFSYRVQKYVRRHRYGVAGAAVLVALLFAFAALQTMQVRKITRERDRADRVAQFMTGMFKISDPSERVGNTVTAREVLDKAANDIGTGLTKDPELQAQMMAVMGSAYSKLGLHRRAQSLFEQSIRIDESALGSENPTVLKTMQALAWSLFQQGHLVEAETLQRRVLDARRRRLGPDHLATLGSLGSLAVILEEEGKHEEAEKLAREETEKKTRMLGPEALPTLIAMDNLASLLARNGKVAEAEKLEGETLQIQVRVYGRENLGTISSMINLATMQTAMGHYDEAEKEFREALELEGRVLGPDQPETALTKYDLACVLVQRGQRDEAFSLLRDSVDHGLHPRIDLKIGSDPDLQSLHNDPRFDALVAHAKQRAAAPPPSARN
jgi:eukaryotic-like serine/threonine-protein kinase